MQRCKGAEVERSCRGAAVQRFRDADVNAEVQVLSCRGAEVLKCRQGGELLEEVQRCIGAPEVQRRCRGGAEVQRC